MAGFLGGISHKLALSIAGMALTSGGAVGLSHSFPSILNEFGVGLDCKRPQIEKARKVSSVGGGDSSQKWTLKKGRSYLSSGETIETAKFADVSSDLSGGTINKICSNWYSETEN